MAVNAKNTRFLLNEFDFSGSTNSLELSITADKMETTPFQADGKEYIIGIPDTTLTANGYFYTDTGGIEDELKAAFDAGTCDAAAIFDTTTTKAATLMLPGAKVMSYNVMAATGDVITFSCEIASGEGAKHGWRIFSGTISTTGAQTAIDFGSAGSAGGYAYLFIQTITGSATDATVDIESSDAQGGTYASEGTFTFSAVGTQTVTMSGTVNRWLRLNATSMGGATSFVVVGIAAVSGVTM